ncbi:hypothetical protein, partial [Halorubrum distributum]
SLVSLAPCGAYVAYGVLATGALEVFAVVLRSITYRRATGALAAFAVDPQLAIYNQSTEDLETISSLVRPLFHLESTSLITGRDSPPV